MPVLIRPVPGYKPAYGAQRIDVQAAIESGLVGAWLINEGAGSARSLINPLDAFVPSTAASWASSRCGLVLQANASNANAAIATPSAALKPTAAVSLFWQGIFNGDRIGFENSRIASLEPNNLNQSPYQSYGFHRSNTTDIVVAWNNGSYQSLSLASAIDTSNYGRIQSLGLAMDGTSLRAFVDGKFTSSSTSGVGAITYNASANMVMGFANTSADVANIGTSVVYVWNRKLADSEMLAAHFDPAAVLAPFLLRRWVVPAAAGGLPFFLQGEQLTGGMQEMSGMAA